jgi:hypothetical protein
VLAVPLVLVARLAVVAVTAGYFSHQSLRQMLCLLLVLVLLAQGVVAPVWVAVD